MPVLVSADIKQGFGTGYGISLVPEVHVGMETRPLTELVPFRLGVSLGARTMVSLGTGVDLGFFKLDTALGMMNGVFGGSKGIYAAVTSQLEF
ncbi:MAG: hypothetical protein FJZ00_08265 [Candidatus Sericytochromatia bacterium]|uniref:DUF5723 domain-containing protein n=1 Tax=Candidatus Tanganyikabacteria bacterium TaxID=2961651 RepID=A0A938BNF1_9BACT|nr:hypothetical protein [Candidatus Tanganyikabacteria bacterium]